MTEAHPLADLVPAMTAAEYEQLRDDIAANGLREPITLYEGKILDGRHRARACEEVGVRLETQNLNGEDPASYVVSLNLRRRNLTTGQLAAVALSLLGHEQEKAKERQREHSGTAPGRANTSASSGLTDGKAVAQAATKVGVGRETVRLMGKLKRERPDLAVQVETGAKTINAAAKEAGFISRRESKRGGTKQHPEYDLATQKGQQVAAKAKLRIERAVGNCSALARSADDFRIDLAAQISDPEEMEGWLEVFREARSALSRLSHRIEEIQ